MNRPPSEIMNIHKSPTPLSNSPQPQAHQPLTSTKNKKLFPRKLWDLINDEKYNFCLRWSDDGQLVYLNRDEFEDSYLKTQENQFHTQKAISFVRQMNMYGFRKVDDCYYENDSFKRDCEHLLKNMIRKHPNKSQNHSELSNFLYQDNPPNSLQVSGAAASLLAPVPSEILNCRQRFNISTCDSNKSQDNIKFDNSTQDRCSKNNKSMGELRQNHFIASRLDEDSLSSSGDCCYNTSGNQNSVIACLSEKNESNNSEKLYDLADLHQKQPHSISLLHHFGQPESNPYYYQPSSVNDRQVLEASGVNRTDNVQGYSDHFMNHTSLVGLIDNLKSHLNNGSTGDYNLRQHDTQALYNVQKELFEALVAQQGDFHSPKDLTTTNSTSNHLNIGSENSNLNAFNSLLTSINNHLYQQPLLMKSNQTNNQNLTFDLDRFSSWQHIYQHILSQQQHPQLQQQHEISADQGIGAGDNSQLSQPLRRSANELNDSDATVSNVRESSSTSLLVRNKSASNALASDNSYKNSSHLSEKCHGKKHGIDTLINDQETKRRDIRLNRSFKRGLDSLLDDGLSNSEKAVDRIKKIKFESSPDKSNVQHVIDNKTKKYATNLVLRVASDRDAQFDAEVLCAVSNYTQQFVEILFDTAQLIARHSSNSLSSGTNNDLQPKDDSNTGEKESNRANINLSDLTSALKLIPSKISNILK